MYVLAVITIALVFASFITESEVIDWLVPFFATATLAWGYATSEEEETEEQQK